MSDHSEIDPALVQAFLGAIPEAATLTQFENAPIFDPKGKEIWYELFNLTNPAEAVTLGEGGQDEISGVFQVNIYVPIGTSTKSTNEAIKKLNDFFVIGKEIKYGSTVLRVTRCGKSGASGESQGSFKTIVSIFWAARLSRGPIAEIVENPNNAIVPNNPSIDPAQAWVNAIVGASGFFSVSCASCGITFIDFAVFSNHSVWMGNLQNQGNIDLSGNFLSIQNVEEILGWLVQNYVSVGGSVDLSNQTPLAPLELQDTIGGSYTENGTFNGRGLYVESGVDFRYRWNGSNWELFDQNANSVQDSGVGDVTFPWQATGWASPVPQLQNALILSLQNGGWSVTTD